MHLSATTSIYSNGAVGTAGQVLTSAGAGVAPTWTTVAGGGAGFPLVGAVSGDGYTIDNVIIGSATPLAGKFTTIDASGSVGVGPVSNGYGMSSTVAGTSASYALWGKCNSNPAGFGLYGISNGAAPGTYGYALGVSGSTAFVGATSPIYLNGSAGTTGQVLTSAGVGSTPTWTTTGVVDSVAVATSNGLAGTSSGGANPSLTLTTTVTGMLKGNSTAISAATAGVDYAKPSDYPPTGTSTSWHVTLPGGFIMQGGYITTDGSGTYALSFPIAFPTVCVSLMACPASGTVSFYNATTAITNTTTGVITSSNASGAVSATIYYTCSGY